MNPLRTEASERASASEADLWERVVLTLLAKGEPHGEAIRSADSVVAARRDRIKREELRR